MGGHMGGHGGGFGEPLIGGRITTSPIYNPSSPYTVTQSPEVGVSPASPDHCLTNGWGRPGRRMPPPLIHRPL